MLTSVRHTDTGPSSEPAITILPKIWAANGTVTGIVYCHGFGGTELEAHTPDLPTRAMADFIDTIVGAGYPVLSCYLGGNLWGNPTAVSRVDSAVAYLATMGARSDRVGFVGQSMGHLSAMNWVAASSSNRAKTRFVLSSMGVCDLNNIHGNPSYGASIDAAYGGAYSNSNQGVASNPSLNSVTKFPALPWLGFYGTSDTTCPPVTARSLANTVGPTATVLEVPGGHDFPTVANWDRNAALDFIRRNA